MALSRLAGLSAVAATLKLTSACASNSGCEFKGSPHRRNNRSGASLGTTSAIAAPDREPNLAKTDAFSPKPENVGKAWLRASSPAGEFTFWGEFTAIQQTLPLGLLEFLQLERQPDKHASE